MSHARSASHRTAVLLLMLAGVSPVAFCQFQNFDPVGSVNTEVQAISADGQAVGWYWDKAQTMFGFRRSADGVIRVFVPPGESRGLFVSAINSSGTITGFLTDKNSFLHGFLIPETGNPVTFSVPDSHNTAGVTINDSGVVAGTCFVRGNVNEQSFVRDVAGNIITFNIPGAFRTLTVSINQAGYIAGYDQVEHGITSSFHGFIRDPAGNITLFDVPGAAWTKVAALNNAGTIAGDFYDSQGATHHYLRYKDGTFTTFDTPRGSPIGFVSNVTGINNAGTVVGLYEDTQTRIYYGFARTEHGGLTRFSDPSEARQPYSGTFPVAINSHGTIAGTYSDKNLLRHGFVIPRQ